MVYLEKNILKMKNGRVVNNLHLQVQQTNKGYTMFGKKNGRTFKKVVEYNNCKEYGKRLKRKTGKQLKVKRKTGKQLKVKRKTGKR